MNYPPYHGQQVVAETTEIADEIVALMLCHLLRRRGIRHASADGLQLGDGAPRPGCVHPVGEEDHEQIALGIDPERRSREPGVSIG